MTAPSFSIVTVALNSAAHIRRAIESVVDQGIADLQYIVIDGKSTDDTVAIVESCRPAFGDRLIMVSETDDGLYDAMNKGIARATGDVIGILNSDDRYLPGALAAVRNVFQGSDVDVVFGDTEMAYPRETRIHRADPSALPDRMSLGHPATFVRHAVYDRWGTFDTRYAIAADYDFFLRCYLGGARFHRVDRVLARFQHGGVSSGAFDKSRREVFDIQARQIGLSHARWRQLKLVAGAKLSGARRALGFAMLGRDRYERIRRRWRRT